MGLLGGNTWLARDAAVEQGEEPPEMTQGSASHAKTRRTKSSPPKKKTMRRLPETVLGLR